MRSSTVWLLAGFLLAAGASRVMAHDLWLEPAEFSPMSGQAVAVHLHLGHGGDAEAIGRPGDRLLRFSLIDPQGREEPVPGLAGQDPAGFLRPKAPGLYLLAYHTSPLTHRLSASRFRQVLEEEGLEEIHQRRVEAGTDGDDTTERYWRCLKALLAVGDGEAPGTDRALGLPLELVAEFDPRSADLSQPLPFRLSYRGEPLAGTRVIAHPLAFEDPASEDSEGPVSARSDEEGVVHLTLPHAGGWRAHAVHMVEAPAESGVEWESFWAALSFELPGRAAPPSPGGRSEEKDRGRRGFPTGSGS